MVEVVSPKTSPLQSHDTQTILILKLKQTSNLLFISKLALHHPFSQMTLHGQTSECFSSPLQGQVATPFFFLLNCQWVRLMAAWTLTCPVLRLSGIAGTNRCNRDVMKNRRAVLWDESKQKGSRPRTAGLRTNKPLEVYLLSSAKKQMFLRSWFKCVVLKVVNLFLNVHKLFLL